MIPGEFYPLKTNSATVSQYDDIPLIELLMMVKNGGKDFKEILESNLKHVETFTILDTGSTDQTIPTIKELQKKYNGKLYQEPFINFRDSRNRLLELSQKTCTYQLILDDSYILIEPEKLRDALKLLRTAPPDSYESFSLYIRDQVTGLSYLSNRVLRTTANLKYDPKYSIHEVISKNICYNIPEKFGYILDRESTYMKERSLSRKQKDLEYLLSDHKKYPDDVRIWYYIGNSYLLLKDYYNAAKWFEKRGNASITLEDNYLEEQYDAKIMLAVIHAEQLNSNWDKISLPLLLDAYKFMPTRPDAHFIIGYHYITLPTKTEEECEKYSLMAYHYLYLCYKIGIPDNAGMNVRVKDYYYHMPMLLAPLCIKYHKYKLGYKVCKLFFSNLQPQWESRPGMMRFLQTFETINRPITEDQNIFPKCDKKYIIFVTSNAWEPYNGEVLYTKGLGGSETFIIKLSEYIVKMTNFQPVIFCPCDVNGKLYNGVYYYEHTYYAAFLRYTNPAQRQVAFLQRTTEYLLPTILSKTKCYLQFHDVIQNEEIICNFANNYYKGALCLSTWHYEQFKKRFPTYNCHIQTHGIELPTMEIKKIPRTFIYTSFPNRGLHILLAMWNKIIKKWPDARLYLFCNLDHEWLKPYKNLMNKLTLYIKNTPSITNYGWQPHSKLLDKLKIAQYWVYPCVFEETFCLAALEAQVYKCHVIANDLAALPETIKYGTIIKGNPNTTIWQDKALQAIYKMENEPPPDVKLRNYAYQRITQNFLFNYCYPERKITLMCCEVFDDKVACNLTGHMDITITSEMESAKQTLQHSTITYQQHLIMDVCNIDQISKAKQMLRKFTGNILLIAHGDFLSHLTGKQKWANYEMFEYTLN